MRDLEGIPNGLRLRGGVHKDCPFRTVFVRDLEGNPLGLRPHVLRRQPVRVALHAAY